MKPRISVITEGAATSMDILGKDDGVGTGAWVDHYACQPLARDQRWLLNSANGSFANQEAG